MTDVRSYFVLTYVNIVGTFLVIATCNNEEIINANTFVRLGSGGRPSALIRSDTELPSWFYIIFKFGYIIYIKLMITEHI